MLLKVTSKMTHIRRYLYIWEPHQIKNRQTSSFSLKLIRILVSIWFHYLQIYLAEVQHFNEYFYVRKMVSARNVQIVCNIKAKPWSHILGSRSEFLVVSLQLLIPGHQFCFVDLESQVLGPESWILDSRSLVLGRKFQVLGKGSLIIRSVWQGLIRKCDSYYKVKRNATKVP